MKLIKPRMAILGSLGFLISYLIFFGGNLQGSDPERGKAAPEGRMQWSKELSVYSIAFSPDGKQVLACGQDGEMRLWEVQSGKEVHQWQTTAYKVLRVGFTPDGRHVFASGDNRLLYQSWDVQTGKEFQRIKEPGDWFPEMIERAITRLAYAKEPKPGSIENLSLGMGQAIVHEALRPTKTEMLAISPNSRWGLSLTEPNKWDFDEIGLIGPLTIRVWDLQNGKEMRRFEERKALNKASFLGFASRCFDCFQPSSWEDLPVIFYVGYFENLVGFIRRICVYSFKGPNSFVLSGDGRWFFSCQDGIIRVWDLETMRKKKWFSAMNCVFDLLAISPDEKQLVTAGDIELTPPHRSMMRLWDIDTGKTIQLFLGDMDSIRCVAFSPDGKQLLSGCKDGSLRLWEVATGKEVGCLKDAGEAIHVVAFSPNGKMALSGGEKTIQLWQLAK